MGMEHDGPTTAPDTFGLQEFYITDVLTEVAGTNVRMFCGVRKGGQVHWLYTAVMPAELLVSATTRCRQAAEEAFNILQMMDRVSH